MCKISLITALCIYNVTSDYIWPQGCQKGYEYFKHKVLSSVDLSVPVSTL